MASVQLNLRTDYHGKYGHQVLALVYTGEAKETKIGLKTKVYPENWDDDLQQARFVKKGKYSKSEVKEINQNLNIAKQKILSVISNLELNNQPIVGSRVKQIYEEQIVKKIKKVDEEDKLNTYFIKLYEPFANKQPYRSPHKATYSSFLDYEKAKGKKKIKDISFNFLKKYSEWLKDVDIKSDGTINLRIRMLKAFINGEIKHQYKLLDISYEKFNYKIKKNSIVRLKIEEFLKLCFLKCDNEFDQQKVDWLNLMTAIGGIRISSAELLTDKDIDKGELTITYREEKEDDDIIRVTNPLNNIAIDILKKYDWKLPPLATRSKISKRLKVIAEKNNLKRIVVANTKDENGKTLKNQDVPLFTQMSTKIARKTFTSICEDLEISRIISNYMSNHSNKAGNASDSYRSPDSLQLLTNKRKAMEKWNEIYEHEKECQRMKPDFERHKHLLEIKKKDQTDDFEELPW